MSYVTANYFLLAIFCLLSTSLLSQNPTFQHAYPGGGRDECNWGIETNNGFLLAGKARGFVGSGYAMLIRTDRLGKMIWAKNYSSPLGGFFRCATMANDGGFIALGSTSGTASNPNLASAWLVKVDSNGQTLWQKFLDAPLYKEIADAPIVRVPNGYVISGFRGIKGNGTFITRVDNQGETVWSYAPKAGAPADSLIVEKFSVQYATDSMLYAISQVNEKIGLITLNPANGDILQAFEYKHPDYTLYCSGLQSTADGNLALMGTAVPHNPTQTILLWLFKVRPDGQVIWAKAYSPTFFYNHPLNTTFRALSDGGFVLVPSEENPFGETDFRMLAKLDSNGEVVWEKTYGRASSVNYLTHCIETSDGGLAGIGTFSYPGSFTSDDFFLMKTDANGEMTACCAQKRNFIQAIDFPVEVVPASYTLEGYASTASVTLTPTNQEIYSDTSLCTGGQRPVLYDTLLLCHGESITIGDSSYSQPGTVSTLLSSATDDCDTLAYYTLKSFSVPYPSKVDLSCPANATIQTISPGDNSVKFDYNLPGAASDCPCGNGDAALKLVQGLPSGASFPVGVNTVCYAATDSCGTSASCCFTVTVTPAEDAPCDVKSIGCIKYELLNVTENAAKDRTYHIRVTNNCSREMLYTAFELPNGIKAVSPLDNATYTMPSGRDYLIRNPNFTPFYSIRFKSKTGSISNGQSDIFQYTVPAIAPMTYIHVTSRIAPQAFYEAYLNIFDCPIGSNAQPAEQQRSEVGRIHSDQVYVYPNPSDGDIFVHLSAWEGQSVRLRVLDMQGREIWAVRTKAGADAYPIQLGGRVNNGLFVLDVLSENGWRQVVRFCVHR